jgi:hypothetical protein
VPELRRQYHFRPSPNGYFAWDVLRLIDLSAHLPVFELSLNKIAEIDEMWWFQSEDDCPTPRAISDHFRLMQLAELDFPVIVCPQGRIMDGMHRIAKALKSGAQSVKAVQLLQMPDPDYSDVQPSDLKT